MTLMDRARLASTLEIERVASKEKLDKELVRRGVANGRIVVPSNPIHAPEPCGIGEGLSVKVNVNLGTSKDHVSLEEELEKARIALKYGADAIMDLSTGGISTPSGVPSSRRSMSPSAPSLSTRPGCAWRARARSWTWTRTTSSTASSSTPRTASTS
jgi:hypothetical protein